jgi:hypothetical protein
VEGRAPVSKRCTDQNRGTAPKKKKKKHKPKISGKVEQ